jgi:hypothetical protein
LYCSGFGKSGLKVVGIVVTMQGLGTNSFVSVLIIVGVGAAATNRGTVASIFGLWTIWFCRSNEFLALFAFLVVIIVLGGMRTVIDVDIGPVFIVLITTFVVGEDVAYGFGTRTYPVAGVFGICLANIWDKFFDVIAIFFSGAITLNGREPGGKINVGRLALFALALDTVVGKVLTVDGTVDTGLGTVCKTGLASLRDTNNDGEELGASIDVLMHGNGCGFFNCNAHFTLRPDEKNNGFTNV